MKIEIVKINQTMDMLGRVMSHCWGVERKASDRRLFACNDSILEIPEYYAFCVAPRSVAMQIRTHEKRNGMYFWCGTSRPDRPDAVPGVYSREQEIPFVLKLTARAIKEISHQRMCGKAEAPTREFVNMMRDTLGKVEPELASQMMPLCDFRGGICTEFNSCGRCRSQEK